MTKKKHTFKEIALSFIIVVVAFVIFFCALSYPAFETAFGTICAAFSLFIIQWNIAKYFFNKKHNIEPRLDSKSKKLLGKVLFCLIVSFCMIFNVFTTHLNTVFKHLLELDALK